MDTNSIKLQLNMTLFTEINVTYRGQKLNVTCLTYHCRFDVPSIPAETTYQLVVTLNKGGNLQLPGETVTLEYWPN